MKENQSKKTMKLKKVVNPSQILIEIHQKSGKKHLRTKVAKKKMKTNLKESKKLKTKLMNWKRIMTKIKLNLKKY